MPYDLSALDRLEQRFRRSGTSLFVDTYNVDTNAVLDTFEFTNAPQVIPSEVRDVARRRLLDLVVPVSGAGISGVDASALRVASQLVPSGGDDTPNMLAMARALGGLVLLGPGDFRMDTPFIAEYYGRVQFASQSSGAVKSPKFFGAGKDRTRITSTVVGQATVQIDGTKVPESQISSAPYKSFWFGFEFKNIAMQGPGFTDRNTCAFQLGGYSYEGQVTEDDSIDADITGFTTILRGDDTTSVDLGRSRFSKFFIGCELNYNPDLFKASHAYFGYGYANASNVTVTNGSPNVTLPAGMEIYAGAQVWQSMLIQARLVNGTGAACFPAGTRILSYNSATGAAVMSQNATASGSALISVHFGRAFVFRNALKLPSVTTTAGSNVVSVASGGNSTNWTTGVQVGQPVRVQANSNGGTAQNAFTLAATVASIVDGQTITVSENASASFAGTGTIYVRDPWGIWEPPTAFPRGGFGNNVVIDDANWFMHLEGVVYAADGSDFKLTDNYFEQCASFAKIGWAGNPSLPNGVFIERNHMSICDQMVEAPIQFNNKSNGTDARSTIRIFGNASSQPRGAPTTGGVIVPWVSAYANGVSNQTFNPAGRSRFTYRDNYLPQDGSIANLYTVDFGVPSAGSGIGQYKMDTDAQWLELGGSNGGHMVLPLASGTLATWAGYGVDRIYCQLTGNAALAGWSGQFPMAGRQIQVVVENDATGRTLQLPSNFKGADGVTDVGTIGSGQASKKTVLTFVHQGNNTAKLMDSTIAWVS